MSGRSGAAPRGLRALGACLLAGALACRADASSGRSTGSDASVRLDSAPLLDIASTAPDGTPVFANATDATRLSGGTVVVSDRIDRVVRFFDPTGRLIRTIGRAGSGPGEFQWPADVRPCSGGDSLFVWDPMQLRFSVFDSAGRFARQFALPVRPAILRCSRSGLIAVLPMPTDLRAPDPKTGASPRYTVPLLLFDTQGDTVRSLGEIPLGETRPLGQVTRIAIGDDRIWVGTNDSAYVDAIAFDGRRLGTVRVGDTTRAPTPHDYERAIDVLISGMAPDYQKELKRQYLEIPMPDRMPSYQSLVPDPQHTLWAEISAPGDSATALRVIAADGRVLGEVRLPGGMRVLEIGEDYLLGVYEDMGGEQHLMMYRVQR